MEIIGSNTYSGHHDSISTIPNDNILSQTLKCFFSSNSTFLDHYSTLKRKVSSSLDMMDHSRSKKGQIHLSENLHDSLEQNRIFEEAFPSRREKLEKNESINQAYEYHEFCNDFISNSQNVRENVNNILQSISSRSELLHELQNDLTELEKANYLYEMDSEIQELINLKSKTTPILK